MQPAGLNSWVACKPVSKLLQPADSSHSYILLWMSSTRCLDLLYQSVCRCFSWCDWSILPVQILLFMISRFRFIHLSSASLVALSIPEVLSILGGWVCHISDFLKSCLFKNPQFHAIWQNWEYTAAYNVKFETTVHFRFLFHVAFFVWRKEVHSNFNGLAVIHSWLDSSVSKGFGYGANAWEFYSSLCLSGEETVCSLWQATWSQIVTRRREWETTSEKSILRKPRKRLP